jgi:hypothetical protein
VERQDRAIGAGWRRSALLWVILAALLAVPAISGVLAFFSDAASVGGNAFNADTLDPASGLSATGGTTVSLSWTATADTYASGHRIYSSSTSGGPYSQVGQVTPRTTTTFVDSPVAGAYFYVVRAYYQNWESANSNEASASCCTISNTGLRSPTAQAADTGGDGDGFEVNPTSAFAADASDAWDANSGTGTGATCGSAGKDRHRYYDYGLSVPSNASLLGIEVRLDASVSSATGTRFMCVELSWDGGTTWTAAQSTSALTATTTTYTLGSSSDTWGRTWTVPGDFSDANFRVRITNVGDDNTQRFQLDWVAVRVTHAHP